MAHKSGKTGNVFIASLLLDDCEEDWDDGLNGVSDPSTTDFKVGSGSVFITGSGVVAGNILAKNVMTQRNLLTPIAYTHILLWAKCNATLGDDILRIALDDDADLLSPETLVKLPALTADVWTYCKCTEITNSEMALGIAVDNIGLEWHGTAANQIVYLDDIRAAVNVAGVKSWTLDYTVDMLDTTDFADGIATDSARTFLPGLATWSGSFETVKFSAPLTLFTQTGIELQESTTAGQTWIGNIVLTGIHPTVAADGLVMYTYDFQGTSKLEEASA